MMPHKIDMTVVDTMPPMLVASATTVDGARRKRLYASVGVQFFQVTTRDLVESAQPEKAAYLGSDLTEAVRIYNGMD